MIDNVHQKRDSSPAIEEAQRDVELAKLRLSQRLNAASQVGERALARVRSEAKPALIGAGVVAALALCVAAVRSKRRRPAFALFATPQPTFFSTVTRAALVMVARTVARRALETAVERVSNEALASPAVRTAPPTLPKKQPIPA